MEMTGNFSPCGLEQKISVTFAQTWYDCFELHCVCNQIKLICVVFWPRLINFMTSSSFSFSDLSYMHFDVCDVLVGGVFVVINVYLITVFSTF